MSKRLVQFRLSDEDHALLQRAADEAGASVARTAEKIVVAAVGKHRPIAVSDRDFSLLWHSGNPDDYFDCYYMRNLDGSPMSDRAFYEKHRLDPRDIVVVDGKPRHVSYTFFASTMRGGKTEECMMVTLFRGAAPAEATA